MKPEKNARTLLKSKGVQSLVASLLCILLGLLIGYIVLLIINPAGAGKAILTIVQNFWTYPSVPAQLKYLGNTLVKTAPLVMCSLSILFAYKVGLFNIGAAGQYVVGAGASLFCALAFGMPWYICILAAIAAGALLGGISGLLKAYCNVNEVISCIMLNWISLYGVNMLLSNVKEVASPYTLTLSSTNKSAIIPSMGLDTLFTKNQYVTIAIPIAAIMAILVWVVLNKTKFGYELKATGYNRFAARYCGMKEKRNIILTMAIAGGLAGMGAALFFLTGFEQWQCTQSSVPAMGFNGIAAAFLGGLNPIGAIFSSYFIQHITNGGSYVDKTMYSAQISDLISALIIYLCGFVLFFKNFMDMRAARKEERARETAKAQETKDGKGGEQV
ncbi:Branched-chain amino acid ABC transporter, permease protein [uncultured Eubacteriales bacterium]|uniref:Branched-chain amino acid ABC transporter, permease protein n=1 Tax=uncultured Eubacteriales bacterium TaxID=172733 RepID=A0A212K8I7_9FIRM|nr:Branched-chain amino acid ABC transporter, permease protein [uncultured Eubacteriales bacterium]